MPEKKKPSKKFVFRSRGEKQRAAQTKDYDTATGKPAGAPRNAPPPQEADLMPPEFKARGGSKPVRLSVLPVDRPIIKRAMQIVQDKAAASLSNTRACGVAGSTVVEGIRATAKKFFDFADKGELQDGALIFEMNGATAPVMRLGLWHWEREIESLDKNAIGKGLSTSMRQGKAKAETMKDMIDDQLRLL